MNGWLEEWMDRWMVGGMDRWINRWMDGWTKMDEYNINDDPHIIFNFRIR